MKLDSNPSRRDLWRLALAVCLVLAFAACDPATDADPTRDTPDGTGSTTPGSASGASAETVDPDDLAGALQISDPLVRIERVSQFLQGATRDQLADVRHTFESAALDRGDLEYVLFIEWWADFDPIKAFRYSVGGEVRTEHGRLQAAAARAWARKDPQGAIDSKFFYNPQSIDHSYSTELLDAIVVGWFESGKPGLVEFLSGLSTISDATRGMRTYARLRVIRDGARETLEWTREPSPFPESHHRLLVAGALTLIAHQDPKLAIEWLPIAEADGIDTRSFAMRIAGSWAHHEPLAALEWVETLPDGFERESAARRAATRWHQADPKAYAAWLSEQKGDESLDLSRVFTLQTDVNNAPLDVDWPVMVERAQEIVDESTRKENLLWVLRHWNLVEPDGAEKWLAAHEDEFTETELEKARFVSDAERRKIERAIKYRSENTL